MPSMIDWRWALPRILAIFLITRLLLLAVAFAAEATQPPPPDDVIVDARPILTSLTSWDGRYYTSIADDGYHADPSSGPDYAFYPGYPIAVRALSLLTLGDIDLAAVLVANGAFLLLLVALLRALRALPRAGTRCWRSGSPLPAAVALVIWGARTARRWTVVVSSMLALPVLWFAAPAMLVGILPDLRARQSGRRPWDARQSV